MNFINKIENSYKLNKNERVVQFILFQLYGFTIQSCVHPLEGQRKTIISKFLNLSIEVLDNVSLVQNDAYFTLSSLKQNFIENSNVIKPYKNIVKYNWKEEVF